MSDTKQTNKRISAFNKGELDAKNNSGCNAYNYNKQLRKAYMNGYKFGQQLRTSTKKP